MNFVQNCVIGSKIVIAFKLKITTRFGLTHLSGPTDV